MIQIGSEGENVNMAVKWASLEGNTQQCAAVTSRAGATPGHSHSGRPLNPAGAGEQGLPVQAFCCWEKEHDVHKGNRKETTESAGSDVF